MALQLENAMLKLERRLSAGKAREDQEDKE